MTHMQRRPHGAANTRTLSMMAMMLRGQAEILDRDGDACTAEAARRRAGSIETEIRIRHAGSGAFLITSGGEGHA